MKTLHDNLLTPAEAADLLCAGLGGTKQQWLTWLANDRKPSRVNRHIPVEAGVGRPKYAAANVQAYIDHNETLPTTTVPIPTFEAYVSAVSAENGATTPFVHLVTVDPLRNYHLSTQEALLLARRLTTAAQEIMQEQIGKANE